MARRSQHRADGACPARTRREADLIRRTLKRTIERVLASPAVTRHTVRAVRGRRLILGYHGIVPAGDTGDFAAERSLFVSQERFAAQVDVLATFADVVALDRLDEPGTGKPRVAITFDDAYAGAVSAGLPVLAARAFPATIFVAPGRLGRHTFWWDALAGADGTLAPRVRTHVLGELGGDHDRAYAWARENGLPIRTDVPDFARSATLQELQRGADLPGVTYGAHSWSHPALPSLAARDLEVELARPRAWLAEQFPDRMANWFAYPYGMTSPAVIEATTAAGYDAGVMITGGWHVASRVARLSRPRLTVGSGMSLDGFRARVLGALKT